MQTGTAISTISKTLMARARTITMTRIRTGASRTAIITFGPTALTTPILIRAMVAASAETHEAETDLGMMADGTRGIVTIIMMRIEIEIETAIDMAIGVPEAKIGNLAKAIAERCPAQRHGVLIAPLGHPLSDLTKFGAPSAGVSDVQ